MLAVVHAIVRDKEKGVKYDSMRRFSCAFGSYLRVWFSYKKTYNNFEKKLVFLQS